jgi:hypothetical protein
MWLTSTDMPFSEFILNKDDEDSLKNGGVILLCGPEALTHAQTLFICKALRYTIEGGQAADVWLKLVEKGVDPLFALYSATYIRKIDNKGERVSHSGPYSHLQVFDKVKDYKGIVARKMFAHASSTFDLFGSTCTRREGAFASGANDDNIKSFFKDEIVDDGWGGKTTVQGGDINVIAEKIKALYTKEN